MLRFHVRRLGFVAMTVLCSWGCYETPGTRPDVGTPSDADMDASPDAPPVDTFVPPTPYTVGVGYPFDAAALVLDDSHVTGIDPTTIPDRVTSPCMEPVLVTVTRIIDGDTVFVNAPGVADRVRLIGVDAPEIAHPPDPADCYGPEANEFTRALQSRQAWLTFDVECRDDFDRLLAYVWVGNGPQDLWSRQLVRRGFARRFRVPPNTAFAEVLEMDQSAAIGDGAGLWSACP